MSSPESPLAAHSPKPQYQALATMTGSAADEGLEVIQNIIESHDETNTMPDPVIGEDEASRLAGLTENVRDQDDLERDIGRQVRSLGFTLIIL